MATQSDLQLGKLVPRGRDIFLSHTGADKPWVRKDFLALRVSRVKSPFREMQEAGIQLVVPAGLYQAFPDTVKPHLMTLESFIADVRRIGVQDGV
jgi:hypothetical protein